MFFILYFLTHTGGSRLQFNYRHASFIHFKGLPTALLANIVAFQIPTSKFRLTFLEYNLGGWRTFNCFVISKTRSLPRKHEMILDFKKCLKAPSELNPLCTVLPLYLKFRHYCLLVCPCIFRRISQKSLFSIK